MITITSELIYCDTVRLAAKIKTHPEEYAEECGGNVDLEGALKRRNLVYLAFMATIKI